MSKILKSKVLSSLILWTYLFCIVHVFGIWGITTCKATIFLHKHSQTRTHLGHRQCSEDYKPGSEKSSVSQPHNLVLYTETMFSKLVFSFLIIFIINSSSGLFFGGGRSKVNHDIVILNIYFYSGFLESMQITQRLSKTLIWWKILSWILWLKLSFRK